MEPRFPTKEAPISAEHAREVIKESLTARYGWPPPFKWIEDDNSTLLGCYAPLCYTPDMIELWFNLADTVVNGINPRHRLLAITGLCSIIDAPYVTYCQRLVAPKVGITMEQFEACLSGTTPDGLTPEEEMAYRLGRILTSLAGPLDTSVWQEATSKLGKTGLVSIVNLISGYRWVSMLDHINGDDKKWRQ